MIALQSNKIANEIFETKLAEIKRAKEIEEMKNWMQNNNQAAINNMRNGGIK